MLPSSRRYSNVAQLPRGCHLFCFFLYVWNATPNTNSNTVRSELLATHLISITSHALPYEGFQCLRRLSSTKK
jgi:hypothetical protein